MCDHVCPEHPKITLYPAFPAAGCAGGMPPQVVYPGTSMKLTIPAAPIAWAEGCAPPVNFFHVPA